MKLTKNKIETALSLLRSALREKYGADTGAQIIIKEDGVSLDDDRGAVICDETLEDAVAQELMQP